MEEIKQKPLSEIGYAMKYDVSVCVDVLKFSSQESKNKFKDDFDETFNLFLLKQQELMKEYGVASITITLSEHLLQGYPTY